MKKYKYLVLALTLAVATTACSKKQEVPVKEETSLEDAGASEEDMSNGEGSSDFVDDEGKVIANDDNFREITEDIADFSILKTAFIKNVENEIIPVVVPYSEENYQNSTDDIFVGLDGINFSLTNIKLDNGNSNKERAENYFIEATDRIKSQGGDLVISEIIESPSSQKIQYSYTGEPGKELVRGAIILTYEGESIFNEIQVQYTGDGNYTDEQVKVLDELNEYYNIEL